MATGFTLVILSGLSGLFSSIVISEAEVARKDGYCVMYGEQQPYSGPAKSMTREHFALLKNICPYLAVNGIRHTKTCCDAIQLDNLRQNLEKISPLLSSCSVCYHNFANLWCELTCSSNQSMFADFQNNDFKYFVTNQFSGGFYNSCRDVKTEDGGKVMDLLCGTYAELCSPEKFLKFIGNPANGAPFPIDFRIDQSTVNTSSNDFSMKRCNQSFVEEGKVSPACSCQNCRDTICPPTSPPPPEKPSCKYIITINATTNFPTDTYKVYQEFIPPQNFSGLIHKYILTEILFLHQSIAKLKGKLNGETIDLQDVCMKPAYPNNTNCKIESLLQYFQMSETNLDKCITDFRENCNDPSKIGSDAEDWHDQILGCTRQPTSVSNGNFLKLPCLSTYGAPILPKQVLADYEKGDYISAKSLILTYFLNDDLNATRQLQKQAWGESLEEFLRRWQANHALAFNLSFSFKHEIPTNNDIISTTNVVTTTTAKTTTPAATTKRSSSILLALNPACNGLIVILLIFSANFIHEIIAPL